MSITEKFKKADREEVKKKDIESGERKIEGPTVKQILADKEKSVLFILHLNQGGAMGIGERLVSAKLTREDMSELDAAREEFLGIMSSVEAMKKRFTTERINEFINSSEDLKELAHLVDSKGIRDAFLRNLERVAVESPDIFAEISSAIEDLEQSEKSMKEEDEKVLKVCQKYGISEGQYLDAVRHGDPEAVRKLIKDNMGTFRKFFGKETIESEIDGADRSDDIKALMESYNDRIRGVAGALHGAVADNNEMYRNIILDLQGQRPEKAEKELSFSELMNAPLKKEEIEKDWEAYKKNHENEPNFSLDDAKSDFMNDYWDNTIAKKKKGLWAKLGKDLWGNSILNILK